MNALLDDINILVCGGIGVGKTSLVRRFITSCDSSKTEYPAPDYESTPGLNVSDFSIRLKASHQKVSSHDGIKNSHSSTDGSKNNDLLIKLKLIDVGGNLLHSSSEYIKSFSHLIDNIEGVIIVIDVTNAQSLKDSDTWLEFLAEKAPKTIIRYLLAHKADLPLSSRIITAKNLDRFVRHSEIEEWGYTVGHPDLIDCDMTRGSQWTQQTCIESVLHKLFTLITQERRYNFFKIVPVPLKIEYLTTKEYEFEDLAAMVDVESKYHSPKSSKSKHIKM